MRAADYFAQLKTLLPPGRLWSVLGQAGTRLSNLLDAFAQELARADDRATDIIDETDPRTTYELLPEWESFAGLPDTCSADEQTLAERQAALLERLTSTAGQTPQYFIDLAAALGYEVTVREHSPRRHGDPFGDYYGGVDWAFVWDIVAPATQVTYRHHGDGYGGLYALFGYGRLECVIESHAPSHTLVRFVYE